jgi:hypothetical protein
VEAGNDRAGHFNTVKLHSRGGQYLYQDNNVFFVLGLERGVLGTLARLLAEEEREMKRGRFLKKSLVLHRI